MGNILNIRMKTMREFNESRVDLAPIFIIRLKNTHQGAEHQS